MLFYEFNYEEALIALDLPKINTGKFMFDISESHFSKILNNVHHPLLDRIIFNHDIDFPLAQSTFSDLPDAAL